ncbi:type VI secretion system baseplate subunit TssG [Rugamonas sp. CCM 8940]|uniref:type VI secretion system baseplate subunit TssG n=1 Tax=Rugamonas sp. CCM 8940 TaxID=2765359 RepID=UPI0018F6D787|nr:type VI secretion system baseplate subunit TssG [Rugamonas sp. CCM 8940]MBJ7308832.1 type VI secretion system baseplate subunit TssG [Rugamonas sp. CCM 8940]
MQAKKRQRESSVMQRLLDEPQQFQFVQAVRILLRWLGQNGVPYEQAFARVLRFRNSLALSFPASEIEALSTRPVAAGTDVALLQALQADPAMQIALTPTFIGLLGVNGTLPFHTTERIATAQSQGGDSSARAFLDMLSHRMVCMFYQAGEKYRLEHEFDTRGTDGQLPLLMALAGMQGDTFARADAQGGVTEDVAAYYAALLRTRPIAASTVSRVLSDYFAVPVGLEQFVGSWDHIPENKRGRLGGPCFRLGCGATLGGRLWRHDIRVRLNIGPLGPADFERFLPRRAAAVALAKMLTLFGLPNLEFEVRLLLSPPCLRRLVLTSKPGAGRRLGWDAFLGGRDGKVSRSAVSYLLHPSVAHTNP